MGMPPPPPTRSDQIATAILRTLIVSVFVLAASLAAAFAVHAGLRALMGGGELIEDIAEDIKRASIAAGVFVGCSLLALMAALTRSPSRHS